VITGRAHEVSLASLAATDAAAALKALNTTPEGLSSEEAARRLAAYGPNELETRSRSLWTIVLEQVRSGINVLLALAGVLTIATGDFVDGVIIIALIALNVGLSIVQEYRAELALEALRAMLPLQARVRRDGVEKPVPVTQLVPGDVVLLRGGALVPADMRLLEAEELEVNQASLTGESVPQTKALEPVTATTPIGWRNVAFAGTSIVGGRGAGVVVATGARTQFGETASLVKGIRTPSDFQVNLNQFGTFLLRFGIVVAAVVFLSNALLGRGVVVSLTLALAVALGVVPEALPAVTATTLALGASRLARKKVLVRRLAAVEDLSSVDTLCADKTGTITENRTALTDIWGLAQRKEVLEAAVLARSYPETGVSIIDDAIIEVASKELDLHSLDSLPRRPLVRFSSETKRVCVSVDRARRRQLVCKGAAEVVIGLCGSIRTSSGDEDIRRHRSEVDKNLTQLQEGGSRVLAVAVQDDWHPGESAAEKGATGQTPKLTFLGLLALSDPPRPTAAQALREAERLGVQVKIVTGDARPRAVALARQIGMKVSEDQVFSAEALHGHDVKKVADYGRLFAEVVPADKYRLVTVLQALGHHVAVTGDGVNDAPALQSADVGIALASGTDATKGASDLVLLEDDLAVIVDGIEEGRKTFTNINHYLLYTMVSNFANVIIVAIASLFLSFLPLLPAQVLLLNVLADLPMLAIVTDRVGSDDLATPRRWDIRRIAEVSIFLGLMNAIFAFALLRLVHERTPAEVHTVWFLFLGSTALFVLLAVRTHRRFWSRPWPSFPVLVALGLAFVVTVALVNVPLSQRLLGFSPLAWKEQLGIEAYAVLYLIVADVLRNGFDTYQAAQRKVQKARRPGAHL
jgi:Mg2+-importing ATPase